MATPSLDSDVVLNNGVKMPLYGLGLSHNGGFSAEAVAHSLRRGVRLLDTAARYGNEEEVGQVVAAHVAAAPAAPPPFITTKLWPGAVASEADVPAQCAASCARLGVDAVDLFLVHWPGMWGGGGGGGGWRSNREYRAAVWRQMELLVEAGRARAVGVSNFGAEHLTQLAQLADGDEGEVAGMVPAVNQIELNPFQNPAPLLAACRERGIVVEGYCPLGKGEALSHPAVRAAAERATARRRAAAAAAPAVTGAQVLLRWALQQGVVTIPKSTSIAHIDSNLGCMARDWALDDATDMRELGALHCDLRVTWDPSSVD